MQGAEKRGDNPGLAKRVDAGHADDIPEQLKKSPALRALYNNLKVNDVADNLTAAQIRQYRLMDNRSHEETAWDLDILGLELKEMKGLDIDLELAGLDIRELNSLLQTTNEAEDDAPPLPEVAFTQPGDLWTMGEHRLLCGDATDAGAVERVCGSAKPFLMVCDPTLRNPLLIYNYGLLPAKLFEG